MSKRYEKAAAYTIKYKSILLPCKHCGATDIQIVSDRTIFPPRDGWSVCCSTWNCDCTGIYTSVKEAIRRWNENQSKEISSF